MGVGTNNTKIATVAECDAVGGSIASSAGLASNRLPTKAQIQSYRKANYTVAIAGNYGDSQLVQTKDITYTANLFNTFLSAIIISDNGEVCDCEMSLHIVGKDAGVTKFENNLIIPFVDEFGGGEDINISFPLASPSSSVCQILVEVSVNGGFYFTWTLREAGIMVQNGSGGGAGTTAVSYNAANSSQYVLEVKLY